VNAPTKIDPIEALYNPYWFSLGRFIQNFADAEVMTTILLRHFAETSQEVSQAIFSGTRGKDAINYINRICEARNVARDAELESAFAQFQLLTDVRNTILHHGARIHGDGLLATNDAMAYLLPRTIRKIPVTPAMLDAMAQDAVTIRLKLFRFTIKGKIYPIPAQFDQIAVLAARPWLYISPSQASPPRKTLDNGGKNQRQRKSSRKK
jgi:hypothetical protein